MKWICLETIFKKLKDWKRFPKTYFVLFTISNNNNNTKIKNVNKFTVWFRKGVSCELSEQFTKWIWFKQLIRASLKLFYDFIWLVKNDRFSHWIKHHSSLMLLCAEKTGMRAILPFSFCMEKEQLGLCQHLILCYIEKRNKNRTGMTWGWIN